MNSPLFRGSIIAREKQKNLEGHQVIDSGQDRFNLTEKQPAATLCCPRGSLEACDDFGKHLFTNAGRCGVVG
jgi:hypothetical protein